MLPAATASIPEHRSIAVNERRDGGLPVRAGHGDDRDVGEAVGELDLRDDGERVGARRTPGGRAAPRGSRRRGRAPPTESRRARSVPARRTRSIRLDAATASLAAAPGRPRSPTTSTAAASERSRDGPARCARTRRRAPSSARAVQRDRAALSLAPNPPRGSRRRRCRGRGRCTAPARIQNRTITVVSGHPSSSKWWWIGAIRKTRVWKTAEADHLDHDRQRLDDEQPADDRQQQLDVQLEREARETRADGERAGVAHEDPRRGGVPPEEADAGAADRHGREREVERRVEPGARRGRCARWRNCQ